MVKQGIEGSIDLHSKISQKLDPQNVDTVRRETTADLEHKVAAALMDGMKWVETTKEVVQFFNKKGLGVTADGKPILHFVYKNVNVCEYGKLKEAMEMVEKPLGRRINGSGAFVEGLR